MCQQCGNNICGGCQQPIIPTGINGVDGINAFNFTTASFTMPAVGSNVPVTVKSINPFKNSWFAIGQIVFIEIAGYFQVVSTSGSNQVNLKNLGYSDVNFTPAPDGTTIAPNAKVSPAGLQGVTGGTGGNGANGTTRVAYLLDPIYSGVGASKTFITQTILAVDMPQEEGSSLVLTFNVKADKKAASTVLRSLAFRFGGQECINGSNLGFGFTYKVNLSPNKMTFDAQIKLEIIRNSVSSEAYSRFSLYGTDNGFGPYCYNESKLLTGLNFGNPNSFVIYGTQDQTDTFIFSTLTVDKIIAQ